MYRFTSSVLDTAVADKPLLLLVFTAIDGTDMRVFVFSYPQGIYMGEMLILPNGMRQHYPFEYEEIKPDSTRKKVKSGKDDTRRASRD